MILSQKTSWRGSRATTFLVGAVAILLIGVGFALALEASDSPQCCDANAYAAAAQSFVDGTPELLSVHNYGYPAFLAILDVVGLDTPHRIAFAQTSLLYLTALLVAYVIARYTSSSFGIAAVWLVAVALLPAAAWSGLIFSESLAVPVLLLVLALGLATVFESLRKGTNLGVALGLGVCSSFAWMVRPGLVWVPAAMGLVVVVLGAHLMWRGVRRSWLIPIAFGAAAILTVVPQLQLGDPLKSDLAAYQSTAGLQVFRYATEMTGDGPIGMVFSPLPAGAELDPAIAERTSTSRVWRVTAMVSHLVTGWDARPSPNYVYARTGNRWIVVTATSGFFIAGVLAVAWLVWERRRRWLEPEVFALGTLLVLFAASQAVMSMTSAEFRFNAAGWLVAACCLAMLSALGWWTRCRLAVFVTLAFGLSAGLLLLGQMTLLYSQRWLEYVNLIG